MKRPLSRRSFCRLGGAAFLGLLAPGLPRPLRAPTSPADWPTDTPLARVTETRVRLVSRPTPEGARLDYRYRDEILVVLRSVVGRGFYPHNHVWFETPEGFLYSSWGQPARFAPNIPLPTIPDDGVYVEVSVPFTDARAAPDPQAPIVYRLYHASAYRIRGSAQDTEGRAWYRIDDENGVRMFAEAAHCRPIPPQEFAPLSLGVDAMRKSIRVSLGLQSLSAFEGQTEVFRTRIASGRTYFGPDGTSVGSLTPAGSRPIWSKRASRHMIGGTRENGYDLPGVPWVAYFAGNGAAIHGTYWHNDFGTPKSAGCLNVRPEDAKWLFRWTLPEVPYVPGHVIVEWPGGTRVMIEE